MVLDQPQSESSTPKLMPLGDHLNELRGNLIWALAGVGVALIFTVIFGFRIVAWLQAPLLEAQYALGFSPQTVATDPSFGFMTVYVPVTLIGAIVLAFPWILFQIWRFVESGLYPNERKAAYILAPFSLVMTVLGVLFARYILLPVCVVFFLKFVTNYPPVEIGQPGTMISILTQGENATGFQANPPGNLQENGVLPSFPVLETDPVDATEGQVWINASDGRLKVQLGGRVQVMAMTTGGLVSPLPDLPRQVKFAAMMMLGVTLGFHLPVVMLVVGWTRLINPDFIARQRKYAIFACTISGAVLTPSDPMSMFVLGIPLYILFEFGLLLMRWADRSAAGEGPQDD